MCSDPALAGIDMNQLRQLYSRGEVGQPMGTDFQLYRTFFCADDEVLSGPSASIGNSVDADYFAEDHDPRNKQMGGQRCFDYLLVNARFMLDLCIQSSP